MLRRSLLASLAAVVVWTGWGGTPAGPTVANAAFETPTAAAVPRIVYAASTGLWSVGLDGSAPRKLDKRTAFDGLDVSPDGKTIAFAAKGLYVAKLDGSGLKRIDKKTLGDPSFSPDSRTIAMVREIGDGLDVYAIKPDGTGLKRLTKANQYSFGFHPTKPLVLVVNFRTLETVGVGGGTPKKVLTTKGSVFDAAFSRDGRSIVYSAEPAGADLSIPLDVYRADATGKNAKKLTSTNDASGATWSPDGRRIVFHRGTFGDNKGVWSIAPDGSGLRRLTAQGYRPRFTADGGHIVFLRDDGLYSMRADGSGAKRIGKGEVSYFDVAG